MNMKYPSLGRSLWIASLFFVAAVTTVRAASYDYYVKDGESGDGSESSPFGSISDAIDKLKEKGGDSIYVSKGTYSEGFTLPKGTEIVGSDQGDVVITGLVQMEDGTKLSKMTLSSGGNILALKGADVEIENVRVKNAIAAGIKAEEGRGTITIRDSIVESSRKGLYMQAGNNLRFEGLEVRDNAEEGLDIREKVSGTIEKSEFRNNGESGLEVVLGDSSLVIRSNTFSGNGASGIAAQFFKGAKDVGDVKIEGNRLSKNDWGIDCKAPQGGSSRFYFLNSLRISGNTFVDNRDGEIAKACKIMTDEERIAFEAEEKKKAEEAAEAKTLTLTSEMLADRAAKAAEARKEFADRQQQKESERITPALAALESMTERLKAASISFSERSKASCLIFGADIRTEKSLRQSLEETDTLLGRIEGEIGQLEFDANQRLAEEAVGNARSAQAEMRERTSLSPCGFSLFGWLTSIVGDRRSVESLLAENERSITLSAFSLPRTILFIGDMAYHPKARRAVVKSNDSLLFASLQETLRQYDGVVGNLVAPLATDADPLPPSGLPAPLAFPTRFANVFSSANIQLLHLGSRTPFPALSAESIEKTTTNLSLAGVAALGSASQNMTEMKLLKDAPITVLEYRETKTDASEDARQRIRTLKEAGEAVVVYLAFDRALGASLSDERKKVARSFIDAGATLVLGSGLSIPAESESYQSGKIAYSQGLVFDDVAVGLEKESKSLGFLLQLRPNETPIIEEKALTFNESDGLKWKE